LIELKIPPLCCDTWRSFVRSALSFWPIYKEVSEKVIHNITKTVLPSKSSILIYGSNLEAFKSQLGCQGQGLTP